MSITSIFRSLLQPDPPRVDASGTVVIGDDLRQVLTPMDIADLEDYFLSFGENAGLDGPVEISLTAPVAGEEPDADESH